MHKILSSTKNDLDIADSLVEFMDEKNRILIIAPISQAVKFKLSYKVVWVCLMDNMHRVYISRRAPHCLEHPNLWDFSTSGYVFASESQEDTALRQLSEHLGVQEEVVFFSTRCTMPVDNVHIFVTVFTVKVLLAMPIPNPDYIQEGIFLDKEELMGFASEAPELLTPNLLWAIDNCLLKL